MESLCRKPPTLLPDRAQRWNQLQQNPRPTPFVRFREGKNKTLRVSGRLLAAHTERCPRDAARSGLLRATPTKHGVRNHRRQGAGRFPSPAAPLRLGAGPRHDSRSGRPTPPEPQPPVTFFINASQRPGFAGSPGASRAPAEPAGPGSPGPRASAALKPRRRCGPPSSEAVAQQRSPRHVPSAPGELRTRMRAPELPPLSSRRPGSPRSAAVPATAARDRKSVV